MASILIFPGALKRQRELDALWASRADAALQLYAGWLWPAGVPGTIGDLWWRYVMTAAKRNGAHPATFAWPHHWAAFTDQALADNETWRRAVAAALVDIETEEAHAQL